jgi:transcriptional regulator with XRE-family HTH domain
MKAEAVAKYGGRGWCARLSEDTGIAFATLSKIARGGTKNPQPDNFLRIADALGVEYQWLATGQGRRQKQTTLTDEERRWLALREMLSPDQQHSLSRFLDSLPEQLSHGPGGESPDVFDEAVR